MSAIPDRPEATKPAQLEVSVVRVPAGAVSCVMLRPDASTEEVELASRSMRGAQHEVTESLVDDGYKPLGPWDPEPGEDGSERARRTFRLG